MAATTVVVCCLFNPCGYAALTANYHRFRRALPRAPLLSVELVYPGQSPALQGEGVLHVHGGDVLWQKERLLQIGIEHALAQGYREIIWADADLVFQAPDWLTRVRAALRTHDVVQAFSSLSADYADQRRHSRSPTWDFVHTGRITGGVVGGAWAARAEFLEAVPLYQHDVIGGGDFLFWAGCLLGTLSWPQWRQIVEARWVHRVKSAPAWAHYLEWAAGLPAALTRGLGVVPGHAHSYGHGDYANRRYVERHDLVRDYDPYRDVRAAPGQAFYWASNKPQMQRAVASYFAGRAEDAPAQPSS